MTVERWLRLIAGAFVLTSLGLASLHSPYWLLLTAFVGVNLLQSGFTNWCLMINILRALGVKDIVLQPPETERASLAGQPTARSSVSSNGVTTCTPRVGTRPEPYANTGGVHHVR